MSAFVPLILLVKAVRLLTLENQEKYPGYLLQFDGSFKPDSQVGGAGFCIFRVLSGQVQFLLGRGIALTDCADNLDAEARQFTMVLKHLRI